jgi:hypothetical protein
MSSNGRNRNDSGRASRYGATALRCAENLWPPSALDDDPVAGLVLKHLRKTEPLLPCQALSEAAVTRPGAGFNQRQTSPAAGLFRPGSRESTLELVTKHRTQTKIHYY